MKKFLIKIISFGIPLLILFLIPTLILRGTGENYTSIDDVITNEQDYLIGYAYNETNYKYLKYKELESKKSCSVIGLGSSRILQFRDEMFSTSFYNAGFTIRRISDFLPFIKYNLINKKPEVLIIALDQWMFNENWDDLYDYDKSNKISKPAFVNKASFETSLNVWKDLLQGKYGLEILTQNHKSKKLIGLNAISNNKGFRKDGSLLYGDQINKLLNKDSSANDFNYIDTFSRIDKGNRRFQYGENVNKKAIKALDDLLTYCKDNNIYVVAILPPFSNRVNEKLEKSGKYAYMDSIFPKSDELFNERSFELWDMTDLNKYGSNDSETIDGFHGGEVSYLRMLIYMVENGSILKNYTKLDKLRIDLEQRRNIYHVYD